MLYIFKRIYRNNLQSLLNTLFAMCLVILVGFFINQVEQINQVLSNLSNTITISGKISNQSGSRQTGIEISSSTVDAITSNPQVKNQIMTAQGIGKLSKNHSSAQSNQTDITMVGTNKLNTFSSLTEEKIKFTDKVTVSFLQTDQPLCIINETYAKKNKVEKGQNISFSLYIPKFGRGSDYTLEYISEITMGVAGIYDSGSTSEDIDMIVPLDWFRKVVEKSNNLFYYDSLKFDIKDPLELNDFKNDMEKIPLTEVVETGQETYIGRSLIIDDQLFIDQATQLLKMKSLYSVFQIPLLILILLLIILEVFLLSKSRRLEIAIALSFGQTKLVVAMKLFIEILFLYFIGCIAGGIVLRFLTDIMNFQIIFIMISFLIVSTIGILLALKFLFQFDVMKLLTNSD